MQRKIGTLRLGLTFAGCFLGAGYVSGQELWQYFGAFGAHGLLGLVLAIALLGGTGVLLLRLSARTGIETMDALIVRADASIGIEQDMGILLDVHAGHCRGATYQPAETARTDAAFAVEGPYDNWKTLITQNGDPIKALMQGKLRLTKGHLPTIIRYVESSKQLLSSAQNVQTEFRR